MLAAVYNILTKMILYRLITIIFFPLIAAYILLRAFRKKEDFSRIKERFAISSVKAPHDLVWIHAVSVGEANSALILLDEILKTDAKTSILFTTTTKTSAAIIANKIKDFQGRVIHQFLPIDSYFVVKKFLNYWRPKKIFFVESEIWPNFINMAAQLGISTFLINGRMSEKSFSRWKIAYKIAFNIFDSFEIIFAQSLEDQRRFRQLTIKEVLFFGNLKSQALNLKFDEAELLRIKNEIGSRHFWLAASTHKGEEEIVIAIHKKLQKNFPNLLTILVPRHPNRAAEIKDLLISENIKFSQRSAKDLINNESEIYLADGLGELGLFYFLADFAFIGGSLFAIGGHNPFEPIKLNCAVISGSYIFNFKEIYTKLSAQNACKIVENQDALLRCVENFLQKKELSQAMSDKALEVISDSDDIAKKIIEKIW